MSKGNEGRLAPGESGRLNFAHLHVRSWFSFLGGGSPPEKLVQRAAQLGFTALALTDKNGVYGAVRFQQACRKAGLHGVIGAEVTVEDTALVLLCKSRKGYAKRYCQMLWMKVVCPWRDGAAEESVSGRPWLISMRLF